MAAPAGRAATDHARDHARDQARDHSVEPAPEVARLRSGFLTVALATLGLVTFVLLAVGLWMDDGHFVYVFDDTAVHMSMARQLADHATWGVTAHHYSSASSSPGWTLLLAAFTFLFPFARDALPLLLNLAAAVSVIVLFDRHQTLLRFSRRSPLPIAVTVACVAVLWFLPGLVLVGMEHVLHAALFLVILVFVNRLVHGATSTRTTCWFLVVMGAATAVRFETAFVAVAAAIAFVASSHPTFGRETRHLLTTRRALWLSAGAVAACAAPLGVYAAINRAFGEGYLPNSILAKIGHGRLFGLFRSPQAALESIASDPALLTLMLIAFAYLAWAAIDGPQRNAAIAIVFLVTALLHGFFADIGWFERYQAYLVIGGSFVAFRIAAEVFDATRRRRVLVVTLALISVLALGKAVHLAEVPLGESNTYRQRYQVAKFLHRYYDGRAFLTGELGYTTLLHDGPVVDVLGLGTYPIASAIHDGAKQLDATFVEKLAEERHVQVMAVYVAAPGFSVPKHWQVVAQWRLNEPKITIPDDTIAFYAPKGAPTRELEKHLHAFRSELPSRVTVITREELFRQYIQKSS